MNLKPSAPWEKDKLLIFLAVSSAVFLIAGALLLFFSFPGLSVPVAIHFDEWSGIDFFGDRINVWGVWAVGFFMVALNIILADAFYGRERAASYLLLIAGSVVSCLVFISLAVVVAVN